MLLYLTDKSNGNPLEFMDYLIGHCGGSWEISHGVYIHPSIFSKHVIQAVYTVNIHPGFERSM